MSNLPEPSLQPPFTFQDGTLFLVNKPKGWTSFDVVNKLRWKIRKKLGLKKFKVGHAGTLDPMATGMLNICTGKWTKRLQELQGLDKTYTGTITLGATTASYDAEEPINETFPTDHITEEMIRQAAIDLTGDLQQLPPIFSAIKVGGQPLYKKARRGESVEVKPRPVTVHEFEITRIELPEVDFVISCSKGTYIRSLAYDLGKSLDSGGYLTALRRTVVGPYLEENMWNLEELLTAIGDRDIV
ncbi:tRNA pseudouridine(55) synthase TruB [Neolewinella antarctica]|uniref:tRNA pseudouridine synthase B n=1 Tax=Neolewinella antarctica TaxID=442734 RepID=A0ABX0X757_9BACT|nr:tRNA pseudouridine(55) synthase TruB [Neolewinella antarctica]NJC25074.1 tRNA pseudouridine55 synthase [Neolewinella antarctica]